MTPIPLDKIGLRWRHHRSALWWLRYLHHHPGRFNEIFEKKSYSLRLSLTVALRLYLHALPYVFLICLFSHKIVFHSTEIINVATSGIAGIIIGLVAGGIIAISARELAGGIAGGIAASIVIGGGIDINSVEITHSIFFGIIVGMAAGSVVESATRFANFVACGFSFAAAVGIALIALDNVNEIKSIYNVTEALGMIILIGMGLGGIISGVVSMSDSTQVIAIGIVLTVIPIGSGTVTVGVVGAIVFNVFLLRLYYYPLHLFLMLLTWSQRLRLNLSSLHPLVWDDLCVVPFPALDQFLVRNAELAPEKGLNEIERLITHYPSQRRAALRAETIWIARQCARVKELTLLEQLVRSLPKGKYGFLTQTAQVQTMVHEIIKIQRQLDTVTRPLLREPLAQALCREIEVFHHRIVSFHEPLATEFRMAAKNWLTLAQTQWQRSQVVLKRRVVPQIFRAGDTTRRDQEAFVPRRSILGDLDQQIMLSTGCPGLVLYGRRRVGKSTLLHNLSGFLPDTVTPLVISMQDPQAFTSLLAWMSYLAQKFAVALPQCPASGSAIADLTGAMRMLSEYDQYLHEAGKRALLAIDEYENIDRKLGEKVFPEDLLATIRESIQTHRNITWIFAGSHEITELKHAEWPSYLVSVRTVEVPLFTIEETRLLLTEPLKFSSLFKDESKRPRFEPGFWGENGIEQIQLVAGGWPHLVQLIAETIVDLINDETKSQVDAELFERSLNKAIVSGHNVLYQLMRGESTLPGEWEYLSAFRKRELQPPPEDEGIYASLRRRLLVAEETGEWRLRVPLMARWLRERG